MNQLNNGDIYKDPKTGYKYLITHSDEKTVRLIRLLNTIHDELRIGTHANIKDFNATDSNKLYRDIIEDITEKLSELKVDVTRNHVCESKFISSDLYYYELIILKDADLIQVVYVGSPKHIEEVAHTSDFIDHLSELYSISFNDIERIITINQISQLPNYRKITYERKDEEWIELSRE